MFSVLTIENINETRKYVKIVENEVPSKFIITKKNYKGNDQ